MSKNILREFYYGNIIPIERQIIQGSELSQAAKELAIASEQLRAKQQPEAIPILERYTKANAELNALSEVEIYSDGFKTGARFMMEILSDSN